MIAEKRKLFFSFHHSVHLQNSDSWVCMQEAPQFVLFSRGERGGAAQVRNILNRAVGAQEDVIRQVRYLSADINIQSLHACKYQSKQLHGSCAVLMVESACLLDSSNCFVLLHA
jgi:hypothetical protein